MSASMEEENPYLKLLESYGKEIAGAGEAALNLMTLPVGMATTGLGTVAGGVIGSRFGKPIEGAEIGGQIGGKLTTYEPQTEAGKRWTKSTMLPFEMLGRVSEKVADVTRKGAERPSAKDFPWMAEAMPFGEHEQTPEEKALAGTVAGTATMALPLLLGLRKGIMKPQAPNYSALPKDIITGIKSVEPNPYMDLMEERITTLRRQAKGVVERPNPQEIEQLVKSGKMLPANVPENMKPFLTNFLKNERGSLAETSVQPKGWTYPLQTAIEQKMPNSAPVEQVRNMIKGAGIKEDEIKWSGLDDYLQGKTKVNKSELMNYLRENQVEVKEVIKGGLSPEQESRLKHLQTNEIILNNTEKQELRQLTEQAGLSGTGKWAEAQRTKFSQWQLPGGENYRELLLTLPEIKETVAVGKEFPGFRMPRTEQYRSAHWDEPNVLAHVRFNDRVDAQGKKVLFLEEVQSDWHQAGREKGYTTKLTANDLKLTPYKGDIGVENPMKGWTVEYPTGRKVHFTDSLGISREEAIKQALEDQSTFSGQVSPAPFSKTWHEMAMRRMVRQAAEGDYDKITWTTGEQQAKRYDLQNYIDKVRSYKEPSGDWKLEIFPKEPHNPFNQGATDATLENYVGKDLAKKIMETGGKKTEFSGLDLKVGGEGMKGFYDKILVDYMNKFGKKWGVKAGETRFLTNPAQGGGTPIHGAEYATVHSFDITPAMKKSVIEQGLPLFQLTPFIAGGTATLAGKALIGKKKENK